MLKVSRESRLSITTYLLTVSLEVHVIQQLRAATKTDVHQFIGTHLSSQSNSRRKISVRICPPRGLSVLTLDVFTTRLRGSDLPSDIIAAITEELASQSCTTADAEDICARVCRLFPRHILQQVFLLLRAAIDEYSMDGEDTHVPLSRPRRLIIERQVFVRRVDELQDHIRSQFRAENVTDDRLKGV